MFECGLVVVMKKKRTYKANQGEVAPAADNLIKRDFHAEAPNVKWITDITEFSISRAQVKEVFPQVPSENTLKVFRISIHYSLSIDKLSDCHWAKSTLVKVPSLYYLYR